MNTGMTQTGLFSPYALAIKSVVFWGRKSIKMILTLRNEKTYDKAEHLKKTQFKHPFK